MSSLLPDDRALKLEGYEIRDIFLGRNYKEQDVKRALKLASVSRHPDAQWLTGVCAGKNVKTRQEAKDVSLAQGNDDARALCFAALAGEEDVTCLRRSAEMGFAYAQAWMFNYTEGLERFTFASRATAQGERDGFFYLELCYENADGCEKDLEKAKENYLLAAKMEHVAAMYYYGKLIGENDSQCRYWWGLAAARGFSWNFLSRFPRLVDRFESYPSLAPVVFCIGRALKWHVDKQMRLIFGANTRGLDAQIFAHADRAIDFFTAQCAAARRAVDAWCLMAVRINSKVNRDIRRKTGMMIWEAREQADYAAANMAGE